MVHPAKIDRLAQQAGLESLQNIRWIREQEDRPFVLPPGTQLIANIRYTADRDGESLGHGDLQNGTLKGISCDAVIGNKDPGRLEVLNPAFHDLTVYQTIVYANEEHHAQLFFPFQHLTRDHHAFLRSLLNEPGKLSKRFFVAVIGKLDHHREIDPGNHLDRVAEEGKGDV